MRSDKSWYTSNNSFKLLNEPSMNGHRMSQAAFNIDGRIFSQRKDEVDEKMSTLGALINAKDEINWQNIDLDEVAFFWITTHECRRAGTKDILAPFARINDGKMYIWGFKQCSKIEMVWMFRKLSAGEGKHVDMAKFFHHEVKQIRLQPSKI